MIAQVNYRKQRIMSIDVYDVSLVFPNFLIINT